MVSTEDLIRVIKERFENKLKEKPELAKFDERILIKLTNGDRVYIILSQGKVNVGKGDIEQPTAEVEADLETLYKVYVSEMSLIAAMIRRKVRPKGSVRTLFKIRSLLFG
ncbi:SCP2 sterol-binding domain-containing protein [Thermogladius sp. 4427co]|uniref:SCP2 sterol-binding domain-containing protein n=1 Tax=Thermogladius sp. 4427co TaxID=3450718 RepID=UPI003F78D78A